MADPTSTPAFDPNKKTFFDTATLDDLLSRAQIGGDSGQSLNAIRAARNVHENGSKSAAVDALLNAGLGNLTIGQVAAQKNNADFLAQHPNFGQAYSYADLAKNALRADPNFDPTNTDAINKFAQQIQSRGYTNKDAADISNLATNFALKNAVSQAQNPTQGKTADQLAQYNQSVNGVFQQVMGRAPTQNELDFFSKEIAGGTSPYELEQALQTSPEYVQKQNDLQAQKQNADALSARNALDTQLQQTQQQVFERATPQIISSFMRAGRLNSSGLQSALAQSQQQLDQQRQAYLANAGFQQAVTQQGYNQQGFVNNQNNAFQQYLMQSDPSNQQRYAVNQAGNYNTFQAPLMNQQRQYALTDQANQRAYDLQNYQMQQNDYMNFLNSQRGSGTAGMIRGAISGAGAFASTGNPYAMLAGGLAGGYAGSQS